MLSIPEFYHEYPKSGFEHPLSGRYASNQMKFLWSPQTKYSNWRKLWYILAKCEKELGLNITEEQIKELEDCLDMGDVDFKNAAKYEKELLHDVMAHVHALGDYCPKTLPIIHLGATSCYVTDNGDLMTIKKSLELIIDQICQLLGLMTKFAEEYKDIPCLAYTHFQAAQPTTVGKRATLWIQNIVMALKGIIHFKDEQLMFRSIKGTTGTQASFLELFNNDHKKVKQLEKMIAECAGFNKVFPVSGQTYTRVMDSQLVNCISILMQSLYQMANDIRLLAHDREIEEPFGKSQIGSSAMPYKRNPMKCERLCSIARYVMGFVSNFYQTASTQWMERTLDDSAIRRMNLPELFLGADACLSVAQNIFNGLVVWPKMIEKNLMRELPFMATENIMMATVKLGGNRQELHEAIRQHSQAAGQIIKGMGGENDLIERLKKDPLFKGVEFDDLLDPKKYIGRAPEQVIEFIEWIKNELSSELKRKIFDDDIIIEKLNV